ncbi:MAG TPA: hypothetical protein PL017_08630 [Tenuifilaceae bacterium]|nr:hypothetical protein [Tenuifilaceae bacterium]HPE18996.1 hypothetical protein [Tenuifilaceae bacterium]HPJ46149.1 hypothetical protein [Tenuifilaceae bacterium]HPQ34697.1 hypothetical protein [Tenuifilaceae bacterium]HRX68125.1 hypothetical protein [Tenuifilaceae bacterium]
MNILIWYNEKNQQSAEFAEEFQADLSKCLNRFHSAFTIMVNAESENADFRLIVFDASDSNDELFIQSLKHFLADDKSFIVSVSPFNSLGFDASKLRQPYLFWDKQYETGEYRLFRNNSELVANYWEKVTDMAVDIQESQLFDSRITDKKHVFLSQDDVSHNADRENLARDLKDLGFEVLPDKPFSSNFDECTRQIEEALPKSQVVIHIIPPIYNVHFPEHHLSISEHQCNVSASFLKSKSSEVIRIIWISSAYDITDEENQVFIEKIQRDTEQTHGTTILKSSIEELKKLYRHMLEYGATHIDKQTEPADVYFISDSINGEAQMITEKLNVDSRKVATNFSGISYNQHLNFLASASVAILHYSSPNEQWLRSKVNDILKSKGLDSAKPFDKVILVDSSGGADKEQFTEYFTNVFNDLAELKIN